VATRPLNRLNLATKARPEPNTPFELIARLRYDTFWYSLLDNSATSKHKTTRLRRHRLLVQTTPHPEEEKTSSHNFWNTPQSCDYPLSIISLTHFSKQPTILLEHTAVMRFPMHRPVLEHTDKSVYHPPHTSGTRRSHAISGLHWTSGPPTFVLV